MVELDTLKRLPYFAGLDRESLSRLASITDKRTIPAGIRIFREGEEADQLYVILRGRVGIRYRLGDGQHLSIQTLVQDDLLVWSAIIDPYKTTSEGIALEETLLLAIDAKTLRESFETDPAMAYLLMHQVAKMLGHRLDVARGKFALMVGHLQEVLESSRD